MIRNPQALYIWREIERLKNAQKHTILFIKSVLISNNFKESVRVRKKTPAAYFPQIVTLPRFQDCVKHVSTAAVEQNKNEGGGLAK